MGPPGQVWEAQVYSVTGETVIFNALKEEQVGRQYADVSIWRQHETA